MTHDPALAVDGTQALALFLGAAAAACLALAAAAVLVVVGVRRAVRRRIDQHAPRLRGLVTDAGLRARAYTRPGTAGEAARLRTAVRRSLDQTRRVLDSGHGRDRQLADAVALLGRLDRFAAALDTDLALVEHEPDPGRVETAMPGLRSRAERIRHSADSLRWAVEDRERAVAGDDLDRLGREIDDEAAALRAVTETSADRLPNQR